MTTLYRPVLIESAEQAEALPEGTIAVSHNVAGAAIQACIRVDDGWFCTEEISFNGVQEVIGHKYMVGDHALVPIEAEEETTARVQGFAGVFHVSRSTGSFPTPQHRLVTPWEEA